MVQNVVVTNAFSIAHDGASLGSRTDYGFLDLGKNDMIVRSTPVNHAITLASICDMVRYWLTAHDGLPGFAGLGSSMAFYGTNGFTTPAAFNHNPDGTGIPARTTFGGIEVSAYDVLAKSTYIRDTNLDGISNAADLSRALQGLNGGDTGWNFGDVNHDGVINFTDLGRILAALRGQGSSLGDSTLPPIRTLDHPRSRRTLPARTDRPAPVPPSPGVIQGNPSHGRSQAPRTRTRTARIRHTRRVLL